MFATLHRTFKANHAFRYLYALFLFEGWIAGLSVRAGLPTVATVAEVAGLAVWMAYEALFSKATKPTWIIGVPLGVVGSLSIYTIFAVLTLRTVTLLAIVGVATYGFFGIVINVDSLKEAIAIISEYFVSRGK